MMQTMRGRGKKIVVVLVAVGLAGLLVWAAKELSGQANRMSQQAGVNSVDYEIAALDSMESPATEEKKPEPPPCEWLKLRDLRHEVDANNEAHKKAVDRIQKDGGANKESKKKLLGLAKEYKEANEEMASLYDDCNCGTKAKTHRELAATRMASAEVVVANEIESKDLEKLQKSQNRVAEAHTDYAQSVESDNVTPEEKERLRAKVLPTLNGYVKKSAEFVKGVVALVDEVAAEGSEVTGAEKSKNPLKMIGAAKRAKGTVGGLLKHVRSLLKLAKGSEKNMKVIQANAQRLAE